MRNAYCRRLYKLMAEDERIFALTADIGFKNFDSIAADFPSRFINVGVAEANMTGIAAGLALSGKIPFIFTIAPFVTLRCMEQIRLDLCLQNLPVKIIGAGGGFVYGPQGTSHHAIEDIGMLRTLPNMTIICPADPLETEKAVQASLDLKGPCYIRIGRNGEPPVYQYDYDFILGKAVRLREGEDITLLTHGLSVANCLAAAELFKMEGLACRVLNLHTIKPLDEMAILAAAVETGGILTVEEHNIIGGLGSAVAEILAESGLAVNFRRLGLKDTFIETYAHHSELQKILGLDPPAIARAAKEMILTEELLTPQIVLN